MNRNPPQSALNAPGLFEKARSSSDHRPGQTPGGPPHHPAPQDHRRVTNLLDEGGVPGSPDTHPTLVLPQPREARAYQGPCPSDVTASAHPLAHPWPPPLPRLSPLPSYSPRVGAQSPSMKDPVAAGQGSHGTKHLYPSLLWVGPKAGITGQASQGPRPPRVDRWRAGCLWWPGVGGAHHFLPTPPASAPVPRPTLAPAWKPPPHSWLLLGLPGLKGQPSSAPPCQ